MTNDPSKTDTLVNAAEAARRLGVCRTTVGRWADRNLIRRVYLSGDARYSSHDIAKLIADGDGHGPRQVKKG